jgi:hypothetical protein
MAIKIQKRNEAGDAVADSSVTIGTDDFTSVLMPNGQHYAIAEILTIDGRTDGPEGPGRVVHSLMLAEESYYEQAQREAESSDE